MSDTAIKCKTCQKTSRVNFSYCLRFGWPKCCGSTMTMESTTASIERAVKKAMSGQTLEVLRRLKQQ